MRQLPWGFRLGCLIVVMMSLFAATSAWAANGSAGWTAYAEGLDALAEGRWPAEPRQVAIRVCRRTSPR